MGIPVIVVATVLASVANAGDALSVVLLTSETVSGIPVLEFIDSAKAIHNVPLSGTAPGRIFNGELSWENVASGTGEFRIVPGTMVSLAKGTSGTEITKGKYYVVPNRVNAILIQDRRYNFATGALERP